MTLDEAKAHLARKADVADQLASAERSAGRYSRDIAATHSKTAEAIRLVLAALA